MIRFHLEKPCKPDEGHLWHLPKRQLLCPDSQEHVGPERTAQGEGHSRADGCLSLPNKQILKDENFGVPTDILTTYLFFISRVKEHP